MALSWLLGLAWGAIAAAPVARRARRAAVVARTGPAERADVDAASTRVAAWTRRRWAVVVRAAGPITRVAGGVLDRRASRARQRAVARELPVTLDLLGVAVDAGCTPFAAIEIAARWGPPLIAARFTGVLRSCRLGAGFADSLSDATRTEPALAPLAEALLTSDRLGAPVGPALARLAAEERTALRRRAEIHARRVPVRLLFPLVFLVLPAFVLLTVVPGLALGLARL